MARELHDHYFREAKREGYLSRAAYKLLEIDDRKKVLRRGDRVLDCGCAPGSWLQVAAVRVGPKGRVVGIDRQAVRHRFAQGNVTVLEADVFDADPALLRRAAGGDASGGPCFDVVLSDLAPNTTGIHDIDHHQSIRLCRQVLRLCAGVLVPDGRLVMKVFEGEVYPELLEELRRRFDRVKGYKPKASRTISREMYIVAAGFKGDAAPGGDGRAREEAPFPLPEGRPSRGWG